VVIRECFASSYSAPSELISTSAVTTVGSQGVGKTSIVHRYTSGHFSYSLSSTIGASFLTKKLVVDSCKVRLQIWDTAGQERFRSMGACALDGSREGVGWLATRL
jgi:small GTP-binding protein